ncbi:orphan G-protein coupled receptor 45 [Elysia marginata]|uniref:Orphan G-protein coupled receptor 45 n=1 Tax=Elysia marginata TaxID=1093978 RepID=A0AAV4FRP6_9GAST|nr:orphan G-protein coupled receptor 45 [Elysia marginata]
MENLVVYNISGASQGLNGSHISGESKHILDMSSIRGDNLNGSSAEKGDNSQDLSFFFSATPGSNFTTPGRGNVPSGFFKPPEASSFQKFAMPVVLSVGFLGGIALVCVFMKTPLRRSALANYLTAAGVTNTVYLLCSGVMWLTIHQGIQLRNVIGICQLTTFSLHLSKFLATWYLVLAHLERFVYQFSSRTAASNGPRPYQMRGSRPWPNGAAGGRALVNSRVRKWCGRFRAKCVIIVVFIFSMVGYLHFIWTYMIIGGKCMPMLESLKHILLLQKVEVFVSTFLPIVIIVVVDISLLIQLMHRLSIRLVTRTSTPSRSPTSQRSRMTTTSDVEWRGEYTLASAGRNGNGTGAAPQNSRGNGRNSPHSSGSRSPSSSRSGEKKLLPPELDLSQEQGRATAVVILEGLLFLTVQIPFLAMAIKSQPGKPTRKVQEIQTLIEECVKVNAAVGFFLYFLMLSTFRKGFFYLILCCCRRRNKDQKNSLQETSV